MEPISLTLAVAVLSFVGGFGFLFGAVLGLHYATLVVGPIKIRNDVNTTTHVYTLPATPVPDRNINQGGGA